MVGKTDKEERQQRYQEKFNQVKPKPPIIKNIIWAFCIGGLICLLGQWIANFFMSSGLGKKETAAATSVIMVFLGVFFTALGVYDELGKHAGAGSVVPITGFANSVAAPAMEFKREGFVFGVGAKMFVIAGPVIVYGLATAFIMGMIYWLRQQGVM